jgi:hypothetical protein
MSEENATITTGEAISRVEKSGGEVAATFDADAFEAARAADNAESAGQAPAPSAQVESPQAVSAEVQDVGDVSPGSPRNPFEKAPNKAADWKALKANHAAEIAALRSEFESKVNTSQASDGDLAKERDLYRDQLRQVAIERDPEFNRKFEVQINSAIDGAKMVAGDRGEELGKLLKSPAGPWRNQKINELLADTDDMTKVSLMGALTTVTNLEFQKNSEVKASLDSWDQREAQQQGLMKSQQEEQKRNYETLFDKTLKEHQSEGKLGNWLYKPQEGNTEHNASIAKSVDEAKLILRGEITPERAVELALNQGAYPRLVESFNTLLVERNALQEKLGEIQGGQPGIGLPGAAADGGATGAPVVGTSEYSKYMANGIAAAQAADQARG